MDCCEFYKQLAGWLPYGAKPDDESEHQMEMWKRLSTTSEQLKLLTFLRGSVGSGKTEAVLFPCLSTLQSDDIRKRLFLVYPTRSLVDDQIQRIVGEDGYLQRFVKMTKRTATANIDTGTVSQFWKIEGNKRTCYEGRKRRVWENGIEQQTESLEFPYNPLYNADIILTTFDKFIFRFFGYGKRRWSYIFPFRLHELRHVTICFDEAHLYESVAFTNFRELVNALVAHGVQVVVMSATLPSSLIKQAFLYVKPLDQFVVDGFVKGGDRVVEWRREALGKREFAFKVKELLSQAQATEQKRIIVTNTVEQAYLVYSELSDIEHLFFYHGRQLTESRAETYRQLRERDKANLPYTLVTTNAIEVGCDLSADFLITELCNPDQLIQRIGRCARKSGQSGRVIVLDEKIPQWMHDDMVNEAEYLNDRLPNFTNYGKESAELITSVIQGAPSMDMRVEMLFGALYDFVYEGDLSYFPLYKSGFVITRSWIPSATLYFVDDLDADWRSWHKADSLSVSLEYLSAYKMNEKTLTEIQKAQAKEDMALEKDTPANKQKPLLVPFRTNAQDPTQGIKLKPTDFRVFISREKDGDYEDNWVDWEHYPARSASAYEHELAILLLKKDFPNLKSEGLIQKLKLFERVYQTQQQRVQIIGKFGKGGERRLWYLQGE